MAKAKSKKAAAQEAPPPAAAPAKAAEPSGKARDYDPSESYDVGEMIMHKNWDDVGEVKEVGATNDGFKKMKVQFTKVGIKILIMEHRPG